MSCSDNISSSQSGLYTQEVKDPHRRRRVGTETLTKLSPTATTATITSSEVIPVCNATMTTLGAASSNPSIMPVVVFKNLASSPIPILVNLSAAASATLKASFDDGLVPMGATCSWGSALVHWVNRFVLSVALSANHSEVDAFTLYSDAVISCSIGGISMHGIDGCISRNATATIQLALIGLPKPLSPQATAAVTAVAVTTATSASIMSTPGVAISQGKIAAVSGLTYCSYSTDGTPLDSFTSPTGLVVGDGSAQYFRGAVAGNMILLGSFVTLTVAIAALLVALKTCGSLRDGLATLHSPGLFVVPFAILLQGSTLSAVGLATVGGSTDDCLISGLILLFQIFVLGVLLHFLVWNGSFFAVYVPSSAEKGDASKELTALALLVYRPGSWRDTPGHPGFKRGHHHLFSDFQGTRQWYGVFDMACAMLMAAAAGVQIDSFCSAAQISVLIVSFVQLIAAGFLDPWNVKANKIQQLLILALTTLAALLSVIGNSLDDDSIQSSSVFVSVVLQLLTSLASFVPLFNGVKLIFKFGLAALFTMRRSAQMGTGSEHVDGATTVDDLSIEGMSDAMMVASPVPGPLLLVDTGLDDPLLADANQIESLSTTECDQNTAPIGSGEDLGNRGNIFEPAVLAPAFPNRWGEPHDGSGMQQDASHSDILGDAELLGDRPPAVKDFFFMSTGASDVDLGGAAPDPASDLLRRQRLNELLAEIIEQKPDVGAEQLLL